MLDCIALVVVHLVDDLCREKKKEKGLEICEAFLILTTGSLPLLGLPPSWLTNHRSFYTKTAFTLLVASESKSHKLNTAQNGAVRPKLRLE